VFAEFLPSWLEEALLPLRFTGLLPVDIGRWANDTPVTMINKYIWKSLFRFIMEAKLVKNTQITDMHVNKTENFPPVLLA